MLGYIRNVLSLGTLNADNCSFLQELRTADGCRVASVCSVSRENRVVQLFLFVC